MVKVAFLGAAGEVTGSCYLISTPDARVLIDYGQHQGERTSRAKNLEQTPFDPKDIHSVVLTHAHIDHVGLLPRLIAQGFHGPVYGTPATNDLSEIMLKDAARLIEADTIREKRRAARTGRTVSEPLFTEADVERFLPLRKPMTFGDWTTVANGVRVRPFESGHILGSVSLEVEVSSQGEVKTIVFSGDIGPKGIPLLRDPCPPKTERPPDMVVLESTYGDRDHRKLDDTIQEAAEILRDAIWSKSKVLIPAFAVGRTQLILYYLAKFARSGTVPAFPIYLDSPMAVSAMRLYGKYATTLDAQSKEVVEPGDRCFDVPGLICTESADQSRALNDLRGAAVIIAGSGMCNGGRILHHLKHNVWKRECHVIIAGYQAAGTIGRQLVERQDTVRLFGDDIFVRAKVHTLGGLSAHAGQSELLDWLGQTAPHIMGVDRRPMVFLTHGEDKAREALAQKIKERFGVVAGTPLENDEIRL